MYHNVLIHSSADGQPGYFHVLAIVNSVVMNIGVYVSLSILVSSVTLNLLKVGCMFLWMNLNISWVYILVPSCTRFSGRPFSQQLELRCAHKEPSSISEEVNLSPWALAHHCLWCVFFRCTEKTPRNWGTLCRCQILSSWGSHRLRSSSSPCFWCSCLSTQPLSWEASWLWSRWPLIPGSTCPCIFCCKTWPS